MPLLLNTEAMGEGGRMERWDPGIAWPMNGQVTWLKSLYHMGVSTHSCVPSMGSIC